MLRPDRFSEHVRGGGAATVPLVTAARGATTFLNGITKFAPGSGVAHHRHNTLESVMVIKGEAVVDIDGERTPLRTYDATLVPGGIPHHFENASTTEEMWIIWTYGSTEATRTIIESGATGRIDAEDTADSDWSAEAIVHEVAEIEVIPGHEEQFEASVESALPLFRSAPGARTLTLERSVEFPFRYRLVIAWDRVDDHAIEFGQSPDFVEWRRIAEPYFAAPPRVEHMRNILTAF
ncbi:MAG TPA: cupin domain-containing protein [Galbitalea sp.]